MYLIPLLPFTNLKLQTYKSTAKYRYRSNNVPDNHFQNIKHSVQTKKASTITATMVSPRNQSDVRLIVSRLVLFVTVMT